MKNTIEKLLRGARFSTIARSFKTLSRRDRRQLTLIVMVQSSLNILDLIGVAFV